MVLGEPVSSEAELVGPLSERERGGDGVRGALVAPNGNEVENGERKGHSETNTAQSSAIPSRATQHDGCVTTREEDVLERIRSGLLYTETDAAFRDPLRRAELVFAYNAISPAEPERRRQVLERIFGSLGERTVLLSPFHAAFGSNVHIGDDFFGNVNLTFIDDVDIRIGDGVMIAPQVTLATTGHPVHPALREDFRRFSEPIVIEDRVWIGSNVVVLPGVRIGYGSVIGAGSVVSRDIPPMSVAVGVPCRVVRAITDDDLTPRMSEV